MKLHRLLFIGAAIVIVAGLAGLAPYAYFWNQNRIAQASASPIYLPERAPLPDPKPTLVTGKPVRLLIPSLDIDLTVAEGTYNTKTKAWTLSKDKAHYALPSIQPNNEQGNTFIYGHYRRQVFSSLRKVTDGAVVHIVTDNGYKFVYTYRSTQVVHPTNVDIFAYTGKPQLTLQTCTGALFQDRQHFFFDFKFAQKIVK
jgi:LPXTG-site transpeptidase (sortase) family protein